MAQLGYARVSTTYQTTDQRLDALHAAGVDRVFQDVMSKTRDDRPAFVNVSTTPAPTTWCLLWRSTGSAVR